MTEHAQQLLATANEQVDELIALISGVDETTLQGPPSHGDQYAAGNTKPDAIITQLVTTRETFRRIGELTDMQLDAIPPQDSFRFCDGQRTLGQVLTSLFRHQRHQLDALRRAVPQEPGLR